MPKLYASQYGPSNNICTFLTETSIPQGKLLYQRTLFSSLPYICKVELSSLYFDTLIQRIMLHGPSY